MVKDVFLDYVPSHSLSDCAGEITILPQFPAPQSLFQTRELAKQSPSAVAFDNPDDFPDRSRWRERNQEMDMFLHDLLFQYLDVVSLAYFLDYLLRSFPDLRPLEDFFPVLRAPNQMIGTVVDRMTRSFQRHASFISYPRARAYADKGDFPVPLITPSERHEFIPAASQRGILQRFL